MNKSRIEKNSKPVGFNTQNTIFVRIKLKGEKIKWIGAKVDKEKFNNQTEMTRLFRVLINRIDDYLTKVYL